MMTGNDRRRPTVWPAILAGVIALVSVIGCASFPSPEATEDSLVVFLVEPKSGVPDAELASRDVITITGDTTQDLAIHTKTLTVVAVHLPPGTYSIEERKTMWRSGDERSRPMRDAAPLSVPSSSVVLYPIVLVSTDPAASPAEASRLLLPQDRRAAADMLRNSVGFSVWAGRLSEGFAPFSPFEDFATDRYDIDIVSEPSGAQVVIDGEYWGDTPVTAALEPGKHYLTLQIEGYRTEQGYLTVEGDGHSSYQLEPAAEDEPTNVARVVVMPFLNLGDPADDYLAGLVGDSLMLELESAELEVLPFDESESRGLLDGPAFSFAEEGGAQLIVAGDYLNRGDTIVIHAGLHDVRTELVKTGLLFERPGGFDLFDSIDSMSLEFVDSVARVLPDVGKAVVEERQISAEQLQFTERLTERQLIRRRLEFAAAASVGGVYGTIGDKVTNLAMEVKGRSDGAGLGLALTYEMPLSSPLSLAMQLNPFYVPPRIEDSIQRNGGVFDIPFYIGPRISFYGLANDIYVSLLGSLHFASQTWIGDGLGGQLIIGPNWLMSLVLDTGLKLYLERDISLRPSFIDLGLVIGVIGLRTDLDLSDPSAFGIEVWLKAAWGVRL